MTLYTPRKIIIKQSLKDLALTVSEKKPMFEVCLGFFANQKICQLSLLNHVKVKKQKQEQQMLRQLKSKCKIDKMI